MRLMIVPSCKITCSLYFTLLLLAMSSCRTMRNTPEQVDRQYHTAEALRPTVTFQATYPISLSKVITTITPDLDCYYQRIHYLPGDTSLIFHRKITERQYHELLSDANIQKFKYLQHNDTLTFSNCQGLDDGPYGTIIISMTAHQIYFVGQCTFPDGFDHLYAFLKNNAPCFRYKQHKLELTRKSAKFWEAVE
ncbi:MAG: hypothetical protein IJT51_01485 [Bacteroidales bacterium]|nr:hypothetical protein [Bacteroidales bacterium]